MLSAVMLSMEVFEINIILICGYLFVFYLIFLFKSELKKRFFLIAVGIQLILLFALRSTTTGIDIMRYQFTYDWIATHDISAAITMRGELENIGYFLTNFLFSRIGISFNSFLAIVGIVAVVPILWLIDKYSRFPFVSVIIYLSLGIYSFQFSGLKQTIAMSIVLIAFHYLLLGLKSKFYFLVFLAILFHPTAIVILPLYSILNTERIKLLIFSLVGIAFLTFLFRNQIGYMAVSIYDSSYLGTYESSGSIGGTSMFLFFLIILYLIFFNKRIFCVSDMGSVYFRLLLVCFTLQVMSSYAYAFTRINYYYIQFMPLVLAELLFQPRLMIKNRIFANSCIFFMWVVIVIVCLFQYRINFLSEESNVLYEFNSSYLNGLFGNNIFNL